MIVAWFETLLRHTRGGTNENYNNIHYSITEIGNTCFINTILVAGNPQVPELILYSYLHIGSLLPDSSNSTRCAHVPFQTVRIRDDSFLFLSLISVLRFETKLPSVPHNSARISYSEAHVPMTEPETSYPGITQSNHLIKIEHKQHDTVNVCQRIPWTNLWNKANPFLLVFMW